MTMKGQENRVPNKKEVPLQGQGIKGREANLKHAQKQGDSDIFQKNR